MTGSQSHMHTLSEALSTAGPADSLVHTWAVYVNARWIEKMRGWLGNEAVAAPTCAGCR